MISVMSLWMPILASAVIVFIASSIIHMLLGYHRSDFVGVPSEDEVMAALGKFDIPPGDYVLPHAGSTAEMRSEAFIAKANKGPVAFVTFMEKGVPGMGMSLVLWFVYCALVGLFSAYIAGNTLEPGSEYLTVFRVTGAAAFMGYALALLQNSIWYKRKWSATIKSVIDGFMYALLTGGAFGWLWPAA